MKKLLLVRHAKATHETGFADFERPLTPKGLQDAETVALRLQAKQIVPQLLVASPSLRTLSTANVFTQILDVPPAITISQVYDASERTLLKVICQLPDEEVFIALVGHNPGISQVLYTLSGAIKEVPPGTVALLEFEVDSWAEITEESGKLTYYDTPKD